MLDSENCSKSFNRGTKPIVEAFVEFLRLTLDLRRQDIYCTTIIGTIPTGVRFIEHIKEHIEGTQVVILLLTENYFQSKFCLAEMGAAWMINKNIYPILVPPLNFDVLDGTPIAGTQCKSISSPDTLIGIVDEFYSLGVMDTAPIGTLVAQKARDFYGNMDEIMAKIIKKEDSTVSQQELDRVLKDNELLLSRLNEKIEEIEKLEDMVEQIKQAKDKKEILKIEMENKPIWEQFEQLIDEAKLSLNNLGKIIQSALFYEIRGEDFWPPMSDYKEEVAILESRERIFFDYSGGEITANEKYPRHQ